MALANPRDHKLLATVHYVDSMRRFVKALDPHGVEYFVLYNAFQTTDYRDIGDVEIGTQLRGTVIDHPKGLRLLEVEIVDR